MHTRSSLLLPLAWSASFLTGVSAQLPECESYGIDFVNNGNYFINIASNQSFTSVTEFNQCQNDTANVELVNWDTGDEYICSDIPLLPNLTPETSTCNIEKKQMVSGVWGLILISNNGDGDPLAAQRTFTLNVGAQATSTVTPTMTFNMTTTPTITSHSTSWVVNTTTVNNTHTITEPAATRWVTITPDPVVVTKSVNLTRTLKTWTRTAVVYTSTATASCTVPPRPQQPDPPCTRWPGLIQVPSGARIGRDSRENYASIKRRLADIRARRAAEIDARDLAKRTADAATITVTGTVPVNSTVTFTASPTTVVNIVLSSSTVTSTLPPATVKTGYATALLTLPPVTKTAFTINTAYSWQTKTMTATFVKMTTVTPTGVMTACKSMGGHFGNGW